MVLFLYPISCEHKKPWFALMSPMTQVPTIKDNNFVLSESVAIVRYLVRKFEVMDHWYPEDLKQRAKIDEFLAWHHVNLRQKIIKVFKEEVINPFVHGKKPDQSQLQEHLEDLNKTLTFLQKHILGDKEYLFGDDITVGDLFAVSEIIQTNTSGRDVLKDFPKLRQWLDLVRATMTPVFEEVHGDLFKFRDEIIAKQKEERREEKVKQLREIRRRESTEPEGEVITLELDDNLNIKPEQNGGSIKEETTNDDSKEENDTEATVQVGGN
ncbi:hypothetical protein BSL78_04150 [Apostichopus japonicus]|uniref:glutathione transferase n=1 Tax=Stichopus japonicus TaxID=307972 RepID=A0A2G8LFB2_STIJA|nr:hypothetical protein BSL78_04150 [Apostichopus japonicus]